MIAQSANGLLNNDQERPCPVTVKEPNQTIHVAFDRGTILLRSGGRSEILESIPGILWDNRVNAYRAPAFLYRELIKWLRSKNIESKDQVRYKWGDALNFAVPGLRPYQEAALNAWREEKGQGVVILPTGAGKTILGIAAIALTKRPAIVLVPTRILLEQWRERLREQFKMPIGILGDGKHELAPVMVATFESGYRYMNWIGNRFPLLIVDEVHHFGSGMRDEALEMCTAPYRLGLTATPVTDSKIRKRLGELIGRNAYEVTVSELTGRYLAPFDHVTVHVDLYPDERKSYEKENSLFRVQFDQFSRNYPGSRWADFVIWSKQSPEGKRALFAFRKARQILGASRAKEEALAELLEKHQESKTLIFTPDTGAAYRISRNFLIAAITSDIKKKERQDVLDKFRRGILRTLVSCRVLNEGIDVPDAEIAVILGGSHGEREHIQRIGRCLRPVQDKVAKVYELVAKNTVDVRLWQKRTQSLAPRIFA